MGSEALISALNYQASDKDGIDGFQRHGSIRKVLHSLVGNDSLLGKSAKMLDRPKTKFEDAEYAEYFREYSIIFEYHTLCERVIPGLYVIPSANSCLVWYGVIFVRNGWYKGGVFRFTLEIPEDFPNSLPPKVIMDPELFHPAVDPITHELNVRDVFPRWSQTANRLWQVLEYTHSIFQQISIKCPLNCVAAALYETNRDEFNDKARECAESSASNAVSSVYHDISDAHFIRFSKFNETLHTTAKTDLLTPKVPSIKMVGIPWTTSSSTAVFAKNVKVIDSFLEQHVLPLNPFDFLSKNEIENSERDENMQNLLQMSSR